ncbi:2-oxo acid dehydrogenase acyltransferase [Pyrenochaeta sp. DS3sAY3a]|nr:2-oxo acid dehydrogenase acyltransferase [Pyrenochaeta sp. DS3sAY3a]
MSQIFRHFPARRASLFTKARCSLFNDGPFAHGKRLGECQLHWSPARSAIKPFLLADIGEGITECQIIKWFVKPGDVVEQFEALCEIQSDKATVEITSRFDGTVKKLHYAEDDMAVVGKPLVEIETNDDDETSEPLKQIFPQSIDESETEETVAQAHLQSDINDTMNQQDLRPIAQSTKSNNLIRATPAVRRMLRQFQLDTSEITATGKGGRLLKEDVQRHLEEVKTKISPSNHALEKLLVGDENSLGDNLNAFQLQMFQVMTRSLAVPQFLYSHSVRLTSVERVRENVNDRLTGMGGIAGAKITLLPFFLKALSQTFLEHSSLNAHLDTSDPARPRFIKHKAHNFGIAIETPKGLLVPTIRDVQNHSVQSLAAEIVELSRRARENRLSPDDFKDATFVVSNLGSIGGGVLSPVIVTPMVAILAIGRASNELVFQDMNGKKELVERPQVTLSWSADHRVLDGATVAKCAQHLTLLLEQFDTLAVSLK